MVEHVSRKDGVIGSSPIGGFSVESNPYRMPRSIPAPNLGRVFPPPPTGARPWQVLNRLDDLNIWLYRRSGGRIGGRMGRADAFRRN